MRRYNVPRMIFINKLDRAGADPDKAIAQLRGKLGLHCAPVQVPMGLENSHAGVIDLITNEAYYFDGEKGIYLFLFLYYLNIIDE